MRKKKKFIPGGGILDGFVDGIVKGVASVVDAGTFTFSVTCISNIWFVGTGAGRFMVSVG